MNDLEQDDSTFQMDLLAAHRRLQQTDILSLIFFFAFGATLLYVSCSMARSSRRAEQRELARRETLRQQEIEHTIKTRQLRRNYLLGVFHKKDLITVLTPSNIKHEPTAQQVDDLEQGKPPGTASKCDENNNNIIIINNNNNNEDNNNDSKCQITLPQGHDEMDTCPSDKPSQDDGGTAIQSIDQERFDSLEVELGEVQLMRKNSPLSIPILCPICLDCYKQGDTVIVSSNVSCTHGFHQECILDYLVQHAPGSNPCPCCRQEFLPTETMKHHVSKTRTSVSQQEQAVGTETPTPNGTNRTQ